MTKSEFLKLKPQDLFEIPFDKFKIMCTVMELKTGEIKNLTEKRIKYAIKHGEETLLPGEYFFNQQDQIAQIIKATEELRDFGYPALISSARIELIKKLALCENPIQIDSVKKSIISLMLKDEKFMEVIEEEYTGEETAAKSDKEIKYTVNAYFNNEPLINPKLKKVVLNKDGTPRKKPSNKLKEEMKKFKEQKALEFLNKIEL